MYNSEVKIQLYTDIIIYTYKHKYKHCMSQVPTDNMYLVQSHPQDAFRYINACTVAGK